MNEVTAIASVLTADAGQGVTAREFMRMIEDDVFDGGRAELIDGVIYKMAPAHIDHSVQNASLAAALIVALAKLELRIGVDLAVETDDRTLFGIDIAVVNAQAPTTGTVAGAHVELAVEIAGATLAKDLGIKSARYASVRIPTYWVVDVKARVVHVMTEPLADGYAARRVVRFGEALAVPGTEGETIIVN